MGIFNALKLQNIDEAIWSGKGNESTDTYYHFLDSPEALMNVLESNSIYSRKRNRTLSHQAEQFDPVCQALEKKFKRKYSYICLTTHPNKVAFELDQPFGIILDKKKLETYVASKKPENEENMYLLRPYSQLDIKATHGDLGADYQPVPKALDDLPRAIDDRDDPKALTTSANTFRIGGLAKTKPDKYQKTKYYIYFQDWELREIDETTYNQICSAISEFTDTPPRKINNKDTLTGYLYFNIQDWGNPTGSIFDYLYGNRNESGVRPEFAESLEQEYERCSNPNGNNQEDIPDAQIDAPFENDEDEVMVNRQRDFDPDDYDAEDDEIEEAVSKKNKKPGEGFHTSIAMDQKLKSVFNNFAEIYACVGNSALGIPGKSVNRNGYVPRVWLSDDAKETSDKDNYDEENPIKYLKLSAAASKAIKDSHNEYEIRLYFPGDNDFVLPEGIIKKILIPKKYSPNLHSAHPFKINAEKFIKAVINNTPEDKIFIERIKNVYPQLHEALLGLAKVIRKNNYLEKCKFYSYDNTSDDEIDAHINTLIDKNKKVQAVEPTELGKMLEDDTKRYHARVLLSNNLNKETFFKIANDPTLIGDFNNPEDFCNDDKMIFTGKGKHNENILIYKQLAINETKMKVVKVGTESIILGKDLNNRWYLLLIDKGEFLELPGGSFANPPLIDADIIKNGQATLKREGGISAYNLLDYKLLDTSLFMFEGDLKKKGGVDYDYQREIFNIKERENQRDALSKSQDANSTEQITQLKKELESIQKNLQFDSSYYFVCSGYLKDSIDPTSLALDTYAMMSYDDSLNEAKVTQPGEISRWYRLSALKHIPGFVLRYGKIMPIIQDLIKNRPIEMSTELYKAHEYDDVAHSDQTAAEKEKQKAKDLELAKKAEEKAKRDAEIAAEAKRWETILANKKAEEQKAEENKKTQIAASEAAAKNFALNNIVVKDSDTEKKQYKIIDFMNHKQFGEMAELEPFPKPKTVRKSKANEKEFVAVNHLIKIAEAPEISQ